MTTDPELLSQLQQPSSGDWLVGGGKMGQVIRAMDWSQTPLGPIDAWPPSLRTTVSLVLDSNFPISLAWGPQYTQIYNDGYWPICGYKQPYSMGQDFSECWASAWPAIGAVFDSALAGTTAFLEDQRMFLDRLGYLEETFFTSSFSPIHDQHGQVAGLFHPVTETTSKMVGQRRTRTLRDIAAHGLGAQSLNDGLRQAALTLAEAALDLPFVLFYQIDADGRAAELIAQAALAPGTAASPAIVDLTQAAGWSLAQVAASGTTVQVDDVRQRFGDLVCGPYPEPITSAFVHAITPPGHERPACIMVAGVSTRLPMNETYAAFYDLIAAAVTTVIANAIAHEAERQRAEALAEIDRAKTLFFSNVSHEFRTPLTLVLGPLEDELAEQIDALPPARRERLQTAHRNSLRLLKLVNTLLDEGTGIGLALVKELAVLHGGAIRAESVLDQGSTFTVTISFGTAHLPVERIGADRTMDSTALGASPFVEEALRWLPDGNSEFSALRFEFAWRTQNAELRTQNRATIVWAEMMDRFSGDRRPMIEDGVVFQRLSFIVTPAR
jgi:signal transduction histidine kinase